MMARNFCSAGAATQTNISERLSVIKCKVQENSSQGSSAPVLPGSVASLKALNGVNQINDRLKLSSNKYSFSTMDPSGMASLGDQKFPATENNAAIDLASFNTRIAENYDDVREAVSLNEPKMCAQAIIEVLSKDTSSDNFYDAKVLDFGSTNGQIGTLLAEQNFAELYA